MKRLLLLLSFAGALSAQTQTDTVYTMDAHGSCGDPNSSACYVIYYGTTPMPFVAPEPEPTYYPSVQATFNTGLHIPITFRSGSLHPRIPTPQFGIGSGTFNWSDGGGKSGTITVALDCRFDVFGAWPFYAVSCNGTDAAGNNVSFTHILYVVGPRRFGYWGWADHHGTLTLTLVQN
jgi:hypothetical protein